MGRAQRLYGRQQHLGYDLVGTRYFDARPPMAKILFMSQSGPLDIHIFCYDADACREARMIRQSVCFGTNTTERLVVGRNAMCYK